MRTLKIGDRGVDVQVLQRALHLADDGIFGKVTEDAVKTFQCTHGLTSDGIVGAKTWAAINEADNYWTKRKITEIIVHCTATKEGQEISVADVDRWHRERGFAGIGYHFLIYLDGSIHNGRPINKAGAHCVGHNANSIGICYVGGLDKNGKPKDTRTQAQKVALLTLLKRLKALYPLATIHGHREFANKACPCFDARAEYMGI